MIWSLFDIFDKIEKRDGKKSATRYLAFSLLIVVILFPLTLTLLTTGIFKGAEFITNEYVNEDRTKEEMNKISERLANKSFVDRAPKDIVDQEKNNYNNLKNDVERISITIKGI